MRPIIRRLNSDVVHFKRSHLHHTPTVVRSSLPTKYGKLLSCVCVCGWVVYNYLHVSYFAVIICILDILSEKIELMGVSDHGKELRHTLWHLTF